MAIREVVPGGNINTTIQQSTSGDKVLVKPGTYTGGINMNIAGVALEFEAGVKVNGNNAGTAVAINANDVSVVGQGKMGERVEFLDFANGIGAQNQFPGRNRVVLKGLTQRRTNYAYWISGDDWLVEDCEADRIIKRSTGGDADYARIFGNRHVVRRTWFHGTQIPNDITPGHTDCLQHYNQRQGTVDPVLKDCLFEENVWTDFVQALFLGNETGTTTGMANLTIRNNVIFGTRDWNLTAANNPNNIYLGAPSWGLYAGKKGPIKGLVFTNNTLVNCSNFLGVISGTTAKVQKNICVVIGSKLGTIWILEGNPSSNIDTTGGNIHWNFNWRGEMSPSTDILNIDPQITGLLGPSGDPFGADALWRPKNSAAAGFGAQIASVTVPPVIPPVTPPTTEYVTKAQYDADMLVVDTRIKALNASHVLQQGEIDALKARPIGMTDAQVRALIGSTKLVP